MNNESIGIADWKNVPDELRIVQSERERERETKRSEGKKGKGKSATVTEGSEWCRIWKMMAWCSLFTVPFCFCLFYFIL